MLLPAWLVVGVAEVLSVRRLPEDLLVEQVSFVVRWRGLRLVAVFGVSLLGQSEQLLRWRWLRTAVLAVMGVGCYRRERSW